MKPRVIAAAAALAALPATPAAAQGPPTLSLGFTDHGISFDPDPSARARWLDRLAGVHASRLRIEADWRHIAPSAPAAGEDPADPGWRGYSWASLDAAVAEAQARGLAPILVLHYAPDWAQEPGRPPSAAPGSWRPRPAALATFARAAAVRYPAVRYWQVWNEPNLGVYLSPQWNGRRPASPAHYRRMLNAVYDAVKAVDPADVVVTAGTAPFGDPGTGGARIRPVRFVRALLAAPVRFDVLAHHVYSVGGPRRRALNADDVTVPDLAKLVWPLRRAEAAGRALPRKRHRVWVTEISWDSRPPDPDGVPAAVHARWVAESLYVLWRAGVDTVAWYLGRDQAPTPSFGQTYQSGVFLRDGTPKPAATAFAFPFVADRTGPGRVRLWGRAYARGPVVVQRRAGGRWVRVARFHAPAPDRVFTRTVGLGRGARLRAVAPDGRPSLTWTVR